MYANLVCLIIRDALFLHFWYRRRKCVFFFVISMLFPAAIPFLPTRAHGVFGGVDRKLCFSTPFYPFTPGRPGAARIRASASRPTVDTKCLSAFEQEAKEDGIGIFMALRVCRHCC